MLGAKLSDCAEKTAAHFFREALTDFGLAAAAGDDEAARFYVDELVEE